MAKKSGKWLIITEAFQSFRTPTRPLLFSHLHVTLRIENLKNDRSRSRAVKKRRQKRWRHQVLADILFYCLICIGSDGILPPICRERKGFLKTTAAFFKGLQKMTAFPEGQTGLIPSNLKKKKRGENFRNLIEKDG